MHGPPIKWKFLMTFQHLTLLSCGGVLLFSLIRILKKKRKLSILLKNCLHLPKSALLYDIVT